MKDREDRHTECADFEKDSVREDSAKENTKKEERTKNMLIGAIYDKVFVPMSEKPGSTDEAMNEKLMLLTAGADMKHMSEADVADLMCRGAVVGQKEGFISGFRFAARLLCDTLS